MAEYRSVLINPFDVCNMSWPYNVRYFTNTSLSPYETIRVALPVRRYSSRNSCTTHSYHNVQHLLCVQTVVWVPVFGIQNFAHIPSYMHCNTNCTEIMTLERKSLAATGNRTRVSIAPGFSVPRSTNWVSPPLYFKDLGTRSKHKKFKRTLIYYNKATQYANFLGNLFYQATKRHLYNR